MRNVTFHPTAAAAQAAGYRACKRCLPDATPGSPDWDVAADVAGRAMRLIADGVVDREGVDGLAARVGYTPRHLQPAAHRRARRRPARAGPRPAGADRAGAASRRPTCRSPTIAFAAGFASIRQFNDTIREVYALDADRAARPPRAARTPATRARSSCGWPSGRRTPGATLLRVPRPARRAGRRERPATAVRPHPRAPARHRHRPRSTLPDDRDEPAQTAFVPATLRLDDLRDLGAAVERVRRLLDADCDPVAVDERSPATRCWGRSSATRPGLRVPGHVDGDELAVRAVLGQQVTRGRRAHRSPAG